MPHIRILERAALMGPNLYAHQPCIKWTIDIQDLEERPSNEMPEFVERLKAAMPSLIEHRCSEGVRGGFFTRLDEGTWIGHIAEHIAIELQNLAGADVGFGKTRSTSRRGVYIVVYQCEERETGLEAGRTAFELAEALVDGRDFDLEQAILDLTRLRDRRTLGPSTRSIVETAAQRGIPHIRLDQQNFVQLGHGAFARRIQATTTSRTTYQGVEIAGDKDLTKSLLAFHSIPVPRGEMARTPEGTLEIAGEIGWPVVVKPLDASHGRGIVTNITDEADLLSAFEAARKYRSSVIIERYVQGNDYRLLVIDHKFVAAAQRIPAHVIGDGRLTIRQLIEIANSDPRRGQGHEKVLTKITIDESTEALLARHGYTVDTVPPAGEHVSLKTTANLSTGGTSVDVTDKVHPSNVHMAQRISRLVGLDIAGIDVVSPRIDVPLHEIGGAVVEVNAAPGFRMHIAPTEGKSRPVAEAVIDMLFPPGAPSRIPIISVTGTNGKTTTARLCAHIAKQSGRHVGLTTTEGIYINNEMIATGDCTGPNSAAVVLREPAVDFAVLETARGGLLRSGLAYDWANIAIVTNIAGDHLGLRDVDTLEDLAHVKAVTVERVFPDGYAVLNAEDAMTPLIEREHVACRIALFSLDAQNSRFREHVDDGGIGATVEESTIVLWERGVRVPLGQVWEVPLTFDGRAQFNVANTLAAITAAFAAGFDVEDIRIAIRTFFPSAALTPGRMNFFDMGEFQVVIDYAHNAHGLAAVADFVTALRKRRSIVVLGVPGDRRDEDIAASARAVAGLDYFILREDENRRGRAAGEVPELLRRALVDSGVSEDRVRIVPEQEAALDAALAEAGAGDLVVCFADDVSRVMQRIERKRQAQRHPA